MPAKTLKIDVFLSSGTMSVCFHSMQSYRTFLVIEKFRVRRCMGHEEERRDSEKHRDDPFNEEDPRPFVVPTILNLGQACRKQTTKCT